MPLTIEHRFPAVADLRARARRRIPHFAWEFVDSGTGEDEALRRTREAFSRVCLTPRFMRGRFDPELATTLFGTDYAAPFGIAPVGMSGLVWPGTDAILARTAARHRIPFALSMAGNETPEAVGAMAGGMAWFQLYPPRDAAMRRDVLIRAREAGFTTLLLTVDVPVISRRERQIRAGVGAGFRITPAVLLQCALHPAWALATLAKGRPALAGLARYAPSGDMQQFLAFIGASLNGTLDWDYVAEVREQWDGPFVLKGILHPDDAVRAVALGVDGILVSNHGARQLDGAPASVSVLPAIAAAVAGRARILLDSGVRSGLDIARAIALGADFVLLGRAFMFGVAALGEAGGDHTVALLRADLANVMSNLGCERLEELRERLDPPG